MALGVGWTLLGRVAVRGIGIVSTLILARLLVPADFGLIAMATAIVAALEVLGAFSFDVVLIQKQDADRTHYDTAWTFNVAFGLATGLLLVGLAGPASDFYKEPRLAYVLYGLALSRAIGAFANIGPVDFRKYLQFDKEFRFVLLRKLAGFAVTVPLAWLLKDYRALMAGIVAGELATVVLSYTMHPYRPSITLKARQELFRFSAWLMLTNLLNFLWHRSSDFIIAKLAGAQSLGLYSVAYDVSSLPTTEVTAAVSRAVYPGYAIMAKDSAVLRRGYLNVLGMTALIVLPLGAGVAAIAHLFVYVMLGTKWMDAVPLVQILSVSGSLSALQSNASYVLLALGRPRLLTALGALNVVVLVALSIFLTGLLGVIGAALAVLLATLILLPLTFRVLLRRIDVGLRAFMERLWRPLAATLAMALVLRLTVSYEAHTDASWGILDLASRVGLGAVTYCLILLSLWHIVGRPEGAEAFVLANAGGGLKRLRNVLRPSKT